MTMTNERLILAIGRLERALARIETGLATRTEKLSGTQRQFDRLSERHQTLRKEAQSAIEQIDHLLDDL